MSKQRLSMRKLTEILRLKAAGLSARQIAHSCGVARSTVAEQLRRMEAAGIQWPLDPELTEEALEGQLSGTDRPVRKRDEARPLADWRTIHKELAQKGVTLKLLWQEYRQAQPNGYRYSQFCEHYSRWAGSLDVSLRQTYRAGERLFVDYAGLTMPVHEPERGLIHEAQVFVAALGASHYLYAEATRSQQLPDWIEAHIHTYEYLQGVPEITTSDNLKSGVARACRYDPDINPTYQDMAQHYGTAIIPTRPRHPRDNAKGESGVQVVEREVLAPLRHQTFCSLVELNQAIRLRLDVVNRRPMQKLESSRHDLFAELDRPALKPLPPTRYEYAEFRKARVNIDYHIEVMGHYYSVPYELKGQQLDVRLSVRMVEVLLRGRRVAAHRRDDRRGRHTTDPSHMPRAHREYLSWTPSRIIHWAGTIGPNCARAVQQIIESRTHPEQGYRAALGIIRLSKSYEASRVDAACRRAMALDICRFQSIQSMLKHGKDREALSAETPVDTACRAYHQNVRGAHYYNETERLVMHAE
ncbi:MAG: integrase [Lentisphaerae bacterium RIFOXYC12_FULL_60_16]|nr:MAG: integrase [Lentisphaerae bacterium RIFOXYC12_FULL_60_16]